MLQHFEEMVAGVRYLVCTYSNGPSVAKKGRYRIVVYQMSGSEIADEDVDGGFGGGENHIQLELMAIEAALERIGPTKHPIVFLTRQKYIADYAKTLRANDFKKADMTEAANIGLWRRIEALDPDDAIEWRFAERDYDEMVEEWKNEKENAADKNRAISRDSI